jgi:excisionase family DNA binding protein
LEADPIENLAMKEKRDNPVAAFGTRIPTVGELARLLGIDAAEAYRLVKAGLPMPSRSSVVAFGPARSKHPRKPSDGLTAPAEPEELLTVAEAADYLKSHPQTIYRLVRRGEIPARKLGNAWRIARADIERLRGERRKSSRAARIAHMPADKGDRDNRGTADSLLHYRPIASGADHLEDQSEILRPVRAAEKRSL